MKKRTIILTGGGTAGHIMPNIALLPFLKEHFDNIYYIGTNAMEKEIVKKYNIPFYEISATKFVRKISIDTFLIPFKLIKSICQAKKFLKKLKPDVIFSKGGYVSVPVCIAGKKLKIPVVSHESDLSMGLANKIILKYANVVCTSFESTAKINKKCVFTGSPIRNQIFKGNKQNIIKKFDYDKSKKTVMFMGGSLGATAINEVVYSSINELVNLYNVLHITGKNGKKIKAKNYYQVPFTNNIEDFFDLCDVCVCRSGANTIFELASIQKNMLLIPLPKGNSRGDQVENAKNFEKNKLANVLLQENLNTKNLLNSIDNTLKNQNVYTTNLQKLNLKNANNKIVDIILKQIKWLCYFGITHSFKIVVMANRFATSK